MSDGEITIINSTFNEGMTELGGTGSIQKDSLFTAINTEFGSTYAELYFSGFWISQSSVSIIDCVIRDNFCELSCSNYAVDGSDVVYIRTSMYDNAVGVGYGGCLYARQASIVFIDGEMIGCDGGNGDGGFAFMRPGGSVTIIRSLIVGSTAPREGSAAYVDAGAFLRIVDSTIANVSGDAQYAIHSVSGTDFSVQLDTVIVDETVNIFSNRTKVLVQNCDGFGDATPPQVADIATCASTKDFCPQTVCFDADHGIDCICEFNGSAIPSPGDCMQSAIIGVPLPSTQKLTHIIQKPFNESGELLLTNVRTCKLLCLSLIRKTNSGVWCVVYADRRVGDDLGSYHQLGRPRRDRMVRVNDQRHGQAFWRGAGRGDNAHDRPQRSSSTLHRQIRSAL